MPSAEDYAIRDRVFGKAMADANWASDLFIMQENSEKALIEHMKRPTFREQLEKNDDHTD